MSELKCNCGRVVHDSLGCGVPIPKTPTCKDDKLRTLLAANARLAEALKEIRDECFQNIDCNHQDADDGSDECTDPDDCIGCTLVGLVDDALASTDSLAWLEGERRKAEIAGINRLGCTCGAEDRDAWDGAHKHAEHCAITIAAKLEGGQR